MSTKAQESLELVSQRARLANIPPKASKLPQMPQSTRATKKMSLLNGNSKQVVGHQLNKIIGNSCKFKYVDKDNHIFK